MGDNVKVAVRVRPFNQREKDRNAKCVISMKGNSTSIRNPKDDVEKNYAFDYSYWSHDKETREYDGQQAVFDDLGVFYLENAWKGYNCSLFAYGQTGAGKSYSMVGYGEDKGVIPLGCAELFKRISANDDENTTFQVEISFLEIYNENIRDLFNPKQKEKTLKIRSSKAQGIYVDSLTKFACQSYEEVDNYMEMGTANRTIAATNMNATSSRGHSVFSIYFKQTKKDLAAGTASDTVSKINLIDLAGSERAGSTGATGDRLKEGAAINKSLSALGNVINSLVENKKGAVIPYRDSTLTRLLQESLGGNAKTIMIAALSPADINYEETLSTLRYADRAKQIKNKAVVNESPNDKLIRELREEVEKLRAALLGGPIPDGAAGDGSAPAAGISNEAQAKIEEMNQELEQRQKEMAELQKSFEEKLAESKMKAEEQSTSLNKMGGAGASLDKTKPHLANLNEDAMLSGMIFFAIKEGTTRVGRNDAEEPNDIVLSGLNIRKDHASITWTGSGPAKIVPCEDAPVWLNGERILTEQDLVHQSRIVFGNNHFFKYIDPEEARILREKEEQEALENPDCLIAPGQVFDFDFAMKEMNASNMDSLKQIADDPKMRELEIKVTGLESSLQEYRTKGQMEMAKLTGVELDTYKTEYDTKCSKMQQAVTMLKDEAEGYESHKREMMVLEDDLMRVIPLVNEANAIGDELGKTTKFSLRMLTDFTSAGAKHRKTQVAIAVDMDGASHVWDVDKFTNRVYIIREQYSEYLQFGQIDVTEENDPFYDPPQEQMLGIAHVFLEPLFNCVEIEGLWTPVVDYSGKSVGDIVVEVWPCTPDGDTEDVDDETWAEPGTQIDFIVKIDQARGIPNSLTNKAFCKYKFYLDEKYEQTQTVERVGVNHLFQFEKRYSNVHVSDDLVTYLESEALSIEVWGVPTPPKPAPKVIAAAVVVEEDKPKEESPKTEEKKEVKEKKEEKKEEVKEEAIKEEEKVVEENKVEKEEEKEEVKEESKKEPKEEKAEKETPGNPDATPAPEPEPAAKEEPAPAPAKKEKKKGGSKVCTIL